MGCLRKRALKATTQLNDSQTRRVESMMVTGVYRGSTLPLVAALVAICVSCCFTPKPTSPLQPPSATRLRKSGLIQIGDDLEIRFTDIPDRAPVITVRVGLDGIIRLPFNVTLTAAGKTIVALSDDVRAAYVPVTFPHLEASITIVEFGCLVLGEVSSCGRLMAATNLTVLRAIEASGGPTSDADLKNIELRRSNGEIVKLDWKKARRNQKYDLLLTSTGGDVIMVPRKNRTR
jgi:protein involved in polysaccharide export with SLBB domain